MIYLCYAIMIVVPYLLCGINSAIIVTKIKTGEDIRTLGSGNAGLTNTLRTQGKLAALFVLLGDVLKGVLSILIVRFAFLWLAGIDTADPVNSMTYVGFAAAVAAIAYFLLLILIACCNFENLINRLTTMNYTVLLVVIILGYIAMMLIFMFIAYFVYSYRYTESESGIRVYQNRLAKIYKLNKEDMKKIK